MAMIADANEDPIPAYVALEPHQASPPLQKLRPWLRRLRRRSSIRCSWSDCQNEGRDAEFPQWRLFDPRYKPTVCRTHALWQPSMNLENWQHVIYLYNVETSRRDDVSQFGGPVVPCSHNLRRPRTREPWKQRNWESEVASQKTHSMPLKRKPAIWTHYH